MCFHIACVPTRLAGRSDAKYAFSASATSDCPTGHELAWMLKQSATTAASNAKAGAEAGSKAGGSAPSESGAANAKVKVAGVGACARPAWANRSSYPHGAWPALPLAKANDLVLRLSLARFPRHLLCLSAAALLAATPPTSNAPPDTSASARANASSAGAARARGGSAPPPLGPCRVRLLWQQQHARRHRSRRSESIRPEEGPRKAPSLAWRHGVAQLFAPPAGSNAGDPAGHPTAGAGTCVYLPTARASAPPTSAFAAAAGSGSEGRGDDAPGGAERDEGSGDVGLAAAVPPPSGMAGGFVYAWLRADECFTFRRPPPRPNARTGWRFTWGHIETGLSVIVLAY